MDEDYAALLEETGGGAPGPSGNADFDDVMEEPTQRELSANPKCPITGKEVRARLDMNSICCVHHARVDSGVHALW